MAADNFSAQHWPIEIRYKKDEKILEIDFDDGAKFRLPAELLRVESPSAEVQGHAADQKKIVAGRRHVGIIEIEPVGNYAVRLKFDHMHDTGIYSWQFLFIQVNNFYMYQTDLSKHYIFPDYLFQD